MADRFQHMKQTCTSAMSALVRVTYVGLWLGLAGGTIYGLSWCRERTLSMPQYKQPASVRLEQLPAWLEQPKHQYIRDQILQRVKLDPSSDRFTSDTLPNKVARSLAGSNWIEQVVSVAQG